MDNPTGWAFIVGRDVLRKRWRARNRRYDHGETTPASGDGGLGGVDDRLGVLEALQRVPPRQRQALVLRYLLDMSQEQVAQVMRIAPGSAAAILHAGRRNLRDAFPALPEVNRE
jgi:RNA polymerase sigma factor (sigma-70 family)